MQRAHTHNGSSPSPGLKPAKVLGTTKLSLELGMEPVTPNSKPARYSLSHHFTQ